jgi:recombination protein RecA
MSKKKTEQDNINVEKELEEDLAKAGLSGLVELAENAPDMSVACVSTGFPQLDVILHQALKGLPLGRDVEIYSKETEVGKTSLGLHFVAAFQKQKLRTVIIDTERTMTLDYLHRIGIITDPEQDQTTPAVRIIRPEEVLSAEEVLDLVKSAAKVFDLVVLDSLAALDLKTNLEKSADEANKMCGIAGLMSSFLRKNVKKRACVVWINQTRSYIGYNPTGQQKFVTMGGRALPFFGSIRLELSIIEKLKDANDRCYGFKIKAFTAKNNLSRQWLATNLTYIFDEGFSSIYDYFDAAKAAKVITKSGAWLQYGDVKAQGDYNFYRKMKDDPKLFNEIKQAVDGTEPALEEAANESAA